jgi:hypothetical protein
MGSLGVRVFDSNATLLVLLLANFFVLELVHSERVGAFVSSLIAGSRWRRRSTTARRAARSRAGKPSRSASPSSSRDSCFSPSRAT